MNEKRSRKLLPLQKRADLFQTFGDPAAPLALVAWGSLAGVGMDALELAHAEGLRVKLLVPLLLYPVAEEVYRDFFASVRAGLFVEQSHQGQLYRVVRMHVDMPRGVTSYARSGANPILPATLRDRLRGLALSLQRTGIAESEPQLG
jgi:2-oxoglutarate ferredoxin oxidoreductase subunit alpha